MSRSSFGQYLFITRQGCGNCRFSTTGRPSQQRVVRFRQGFPVSQCFTNARTPQKLCLAVALHKSSNFSGGVFGWGVASGGTRGLITCKWLTDSKVVESTTRPRKPPQNLEVPLPCGGNSFSVHTGLTMATPSRTLDEMQAGWILFALAQP